MLERLSFQKLLLYKILLLLLIYTLCRLIFLAFNPSFFQFGFIEIIHAFYVGLLFDFSAIIYTNSLLILLLVLPFKFRAAIWFQHTINILFYTINSVAVFLNLIDTIYYKFSGKRSGLELLKMSDELAGVWKNYLLDYWYIVIILLSVILLLFKFNKWIVKSVNFIGIIYNTKQYITELIALLIISAICFLGARGSVNLTPLNTFDAARISRAELVPLIVNTPFQFLISTQQVGLLTKNYFDNNIINQYFNPRKIIFQTDSVKNKPNIIILILESVGKEYVGYFNNGIGYTPFIDSLMNKSLVYTHAYANGKRSIEGIPAIIASMPTWMDNDYMSSYYQSNKLKSLGAYLKELNYQTSFFHGGKNGTMSFDNFTAITNEGKYFGLNEYPNKSDFDQHWGIFDEPYLQYFSDQLSANKQPFYATLFTLSSHHPYSIPEHLKTSFTEGTLPIHRTIKYADYALQQFFANAKNKPWYNNTIFIVTADHSAENEKPYYQTAQGKYEIPLFVFSANEQLVKPKINNSTMQQIDILPMALNYVSYPKEFYSFGENIGQNHWAMQLTNGFYQYITWPYVYHFDGKTGLAFFDLKKDSFMRTNQIRNFKYSKQINSLDSAVKCIVQQYNNDLINNTTHIN
jgi:phosphoglycerol transferase MdoB-like AlkP superfamily enzyme